MSNTETPPRRIDEPATAYRAFLIYLELGPGRTLDGAWSAYCESRTPGRTPKRCSGQWTRWSQQHKWVERALEHEIAELDRRRTLRAERREQLDERRAEYEISTQADAEAEYDRGRRFLDKLENVPSADMSHHKTEIVKGKTTHTSTTARGIRGGEIAKLMQEVRETRNAAILGPGAGTPGRTVERKADHIFTRSAEEKKAA